ncbi:phage holin [Cytobacillus purgationiresistens]|uniref:SPP1 family holin n=1 Tax=Cytobacillus purgationiresistens TaxID=863449 RepID=A0ABU0AJ19_9BACI|nr:phage holin [Cytobacillus purgationiresistens]MDQ0270711.1 SPP1 family holin [Cytobacillus purgationiresistens]
MNNTKPINAGTVSRFILLLLALVNTGLEMAGMSVIPVDADGVSEFISFAFLGGTALWSYWKNNDVTKKTREE